ncbi:MAG: hypothetical protein HZA60_09935 [Deltaproteobacteria bacterium]|nr:hypothetical protein [Deltaproteobacteria bacterium]
MNPPGGHGGQAGVPPLLRSWFGDAPSPAYLLGGDGAGLADLVAELWMRRFGEQGIAADLTRWTPADLERESLEAVWRTPSFFVRYRLFILPDLGDLKKGVRDGILAYLSAPDPTVVLVLPSTDRGATRSFSSVPAVRSAVLREEQAASVLAQFTVSVASGAGKELSEDAAAFLVRWVGLDYSRIREEMEKLLSFGADRKEIGEEEIRQVCVAGGAIDPFALAEKLVREDKRGCITLFRQFAAGAESADYHALVGAVAWVVRKRLAGQGTGLSPRRGGEILTAMSWIDRGMKGESRLSPEQLFEIRLLKLLA